MRQLQRGRAHCWPPSPRPVPDVAGLIELNELIAAADAADDTRVITGRASTIGAALAAEGPMLSALPVEPFDAARLLEARVDGRARVCVRRCYDSVPARFAGRRLPVRLSATTVEILDGARIVACHERAAGRYVEVLVLDHYLEVLKTKPARCPGRLRSPKPKRPARSLPRIKRFGMRPGTRAAMRPARRR
jgi:hypothetical protein